MVCITEPLMYNHVQLLVIAHIIICRKKLFQFIIIRRSYIEVLNILPKSIKYSYKLVDVCLPDT